MSELMECPRCKYIALKRIGVTENPPRIESWECDECGHAEAYHVADVTPINKYPGFDDFIQEIGMDELDKLSFMDAMRIAFLGGRCYESKRDIEALKKVRVQAE